MALDDWDFDSDAMHVVETSLVHYFDQLSSGYLDSEDGYVYATESGLPFCGCTTCTCREILAWLVPRIAELHEKGKLWRVASNS
jgi:hypothetical protein